MTDIYPITSFNHEALHTLGFGHEFTVPERDKFVTIMWKNIKESKKA